MGDMTRRDFLKILGIGAATGVFSLAIQGGIAKDVKINKEHVPGAGSPGKLKEEEIDKIRPERFIGACARCGICLNECPNNAIKFGDGHYPRLTDKSAMKCPGYYDCGVCLSVCPTNALGFAFEDLKDPKIKRFK